MFAVNFGNFPVTGIRPPGSLSPPSFRRPHLPGNRASRKRQGIRS